MSPNLERAQQQAAPRCFREVATSGEGLNNCFVEPQEFVHNSELKLYINQQWVQDLIMRTTSSRRVDAVHMGHPCGTSSRARNIPIKKNLRKAGAPNPVPLRSSKFPQGFPWLKGVNLIKVQAANSLYDFASKSRAALYPLVGHFTESCNFKRWKGKL